MNFTTVAGGLKPTDLLNVRRRPGKFSVDQTAALLGFASHDTPVLVRAKLLKPLGKPRLNSCKWFASTEIEELRVSHKWLDMATKAVGDARRYPIDRRKPDSPSPSEQATPMTKEITRVWSFASDSNAKW
jgi:hypothetical protein